MTTDNRGNIGLVKKVHQNKDIRAAIEEAVAENFIWEPPPGGSSHAKGVLKCPCKKHSSCKNNTCSMFVRSTPVNKEKAAKNIRRFVRKCGVQLEKQQKKDEDAQLAKTQRQAARKKRNDQ